MQISTFLRSPCWRIRWDSQLGLDLSFGKPYLEIREPQASDSKSKLVRDAFSRRLVTVRASSWLWIQAARWSLTLADGRQAAWNGSAKTRNLAFQRLEGEKIVRVDIELKTGRTVFHFDLGASLTVRRLGKAGDDTLWTLYKPNGYCFTVRSDGSYSHGRGSEPAKWHPME